MPVTAGWTQNDNECVKLPSDGNYTSSPDKKYYVYFKQKTVFDGDGETFGKSFYLFSKSEQVGEEEGVVAQGMAGCAAAEIILNFGDKT